MRKKLQDEWYQSTIQNENEEKRNSRLKRNNELNPVILLRNLNPPRLCNGTRLQISKMHDNILEATIISGEQKRRKSHHTKNTNLPKGIPF